MSSIFFFRVESYFGVAKQVFWGVRTELLGCYVLSGGYPGSWPQQHQLYLQYSGTR